LIYDSPKNNRAAPTQPGTALIVFK
jgi:hypothetical protein